jgi:predicted negative regulator of RcsB-dependent stress response
MPGVDSKPDAYYRQWPHPCTDDELRAEKYLKTLDAREALGVFAHLRGACLEENQRYQEAAQAYAIALRSFPDSKYLQAYLNNVKGKN